MVGKAWGRNSQYVVSFGKRSIVHFVCFGQVVDVFIPFQCHGCFDAAHFSICGLHFIAIFQNGGLSLLYAVDDCNSFLFMPFNIKASPLFELGPET